MAQRPERRPRAERERRKAEKIATAEELKAVLSNIALNGTHEMVRVHAATALLDRIEGKAVQRNLNVNTYADRSDAELARELDEIRARARGADRARGVAEEVSARPDGLVH